MALRASSRVRELVTMRRAGSNSPWIGGGKTLAALPLLRKRFGRRETNLSKDKTLCRRARGVIACSALASSCSVPP
jgi:hypothetical protein